MTRRPDMILEFGRWLGRRLEAEGKGEVEVYAEAHVSLNGRPRQPLIDPEVDLMTIEDRLWPPADWILPLVSHENRRP